MTADHAVVPIALFAKRTRMAKVMTICAIGWGIAATASAAVTNFAGAFACRFFVGLGGTSTDPFLPLRDRDILTWQRPATPP